MILERRKFFPSWPLISSLLLHGVLVSFMMSRNFLIPTESLPKLITVHIVEEKKDQTLTTPLPLPPKTKKVQEIARPKIPTRAVAPSKEEPLPPPMQQSAEKKTPQVEAFAEEKVWAEEKPKEDVVEKIDSFRFGDPEGPRDAEPLPSAKEESTLRLTPESATAQKGILGGLAAVNPWGKGSGAAVGFPGGTEGGKGTVPPKGVQTGSVHFMGEGKAELSSYLANARLRIEKAKKYPREARRRGWEGKVVLSFEINRNGEAHEIKLVQSSGYRTLDDEGILTLRRASPFSSPLLIQKEKLVLEVPIVFKLE
jgi:protein TonB